jgi:hypothetical protein
MPTPATPESTSCVTAPSASIWRRSATVGNLERLHCVDHASSREHDVDNDGEFGLEAAQHATDFGTQTVNAD